MKKMIWYNKNAYLWTNTGIVASRRLITINKEKEWGYSGGCKTN